MELRRYSFLSSAIFLANASASSKFPSMDRTLAPKKRAWASFPMATLPEGRKTAHLIPAFAA